MGMQVEVENDLYNNENTLENTTVPYQENVEATETDLVECTKKEMELVQGIERYRRLSYRIKTAGSCWWAEFGFREQPFEYSQGHFASPQHQVGNQAKSQTPSSMGCS